MQFVDLERQREHELRLTPDRALETLDDAAEFARDRGFLTLMPSSALPSLFAACHEEPYAPNKGGFGQWPKTKYWWGVALAAERGILSTRLHRGKGLFLTEETAALADPLCREALAAGEAGEHGEDARRLVELLEAGGPAMLDDVKTELGLDAKPCAACGAASNESARSSRARCASRPETVIATSASFIAGIRSWSRPRAGSQTCLARPFEPRSSRPNARRCAGSRGPFQRRSSTSWWSRGG